MNILEKYSEVEASLQELQEQLESGDGEPAPEVLAEAVALQDALAELQKVAESTLELGNELGDKLSNENEATLGKDIKNVVSKTIEGLGAPSPFNSSK